MMEIPNRPMNWGCASCEHWISKEEEEMCQNCGEYFCIPCFDKHGFDLDCEPCSDCGQIHIMEGCPAAPE